MYKLNFTLKQHTPLIHFQHDQAGATLRATEVKPKLDRFIIAKLGDGDFEKGKKIAEDYGWLVGNGDKPALDYKMRIELLSNHSEKDLASLRSFEKIKIDERGNYKVKKDKDRQDKLDDYDVPIYERELGLKGFFGNMDKETDRKELISAKEISIFIHTSNYDLKKEIENCFSTFVFHHNFGTRQSKGFGSFSVSDEFNEGFYSFFDIVIPNNFTLYQKYNFLFDRINLFYSALRSGINLKRPTKDKLQKKVKDVNGLDVYSDVYYFKSLLFLYAKEKLNAQWEKKSIKEAFFLNDRTYLDKETGNRKISYYGLLTQQSNRVLHVNTPLHFSLGTKILIKDLLGLSSSEAWLSYKNSTIVKTEALRNGTKTTPENQSVFRYKSPIQFKPIWIESNKCRVYIQILEDKPTILDKWFCIDTGGSSSLYLKTPSLFLISDFFKFIFEEKDSKGEFYFEIDKHVEHTSGFHSTNEHISLKQIFNSIRSNKI